MKYQRLISVFLSICCLYMVSCKPQKADQQHSIDAPKGMVYIPSGTLNMGGDNEQADANEYPKHQVKIKPFFMDETEVTNDQFAAFVNATDYITVAERELD